MWKLDDSNADTLILQNYIAPGRHTVSPDNQKSRATRKQRGKLRRIGHRIRAVVEAQHVADDLNVCINSHTPTGKNFSCHADSISQRLIVLDRDVRTEFNIDSHRAIADVVVLYYRGLRLTDVDASII